MKLSRADKDARIVELYKNGWSYRQLQKRYRRSPNYIARLVQEIKATCATCGKLKGKARFHAHHPDRLNRPDYTIPLCSSCHAKEEAKLRRQKENKSQSLLSVALTTTENTANEPSTASLSSLLGPLSSTEKGVITGIGIAILVETLSPGFFERRWQEIQDHWKRS